MARYRKVELATWSDDRFLSLSRAEPNGQTLWLYLLCGPRTTIFPGVVIAREEVIASDLGWSPERFRETFEEVSQQGLVKVDWKAGLVVLKKALFDSSGDPRDTAKPSNPNQLKGWASSWETIPECSLKFEYLQDLESFAKSLDKPSPKGFHKGFMEAFAKALAKRAKPSPTQDTGDRKQDSGNRKAESPPPVVTTKAKPAKVRPPIPPEAEASARRLLDRISANTPGSTLARLSESAKLDRARKWADAFRLLHERDGHPWADINAMIDWCQADPFWKSNILSGDKLREKWDQLAAKRVAANGDGYDVRYGRARLPSPEEYEQDDDPFGERTPKPAVAS